ncbi:RING finger protein [Cardinium endosymbiont of Culicoides punctatus]|uniref:RING finger protein n=1 Tax=Cardinium endosymbiont of Culicoides punctatus TaxID=2304601 RepID=UPI00105909A3|nr:RING finger protein [Cardinium endosymbiont of Culicoides punctatus]TDG95427.1 hypothetical protein CCPUN_04030 [Cardinium endosymbiont of Culicoides punctatus]
MILYNFYALLKKVRGSLYAITILLHVVTSSCTRRLTHMHNGTSSSKTVHTTIDSGKLEALEETVNMLPKLGYKLDDQDSDGNTLLHGSVLENDPDAVNVLLKNRVNKFKVNKDGNMPLDIAKKHSYSNLIEVLSQTCSICLEDIYFQYSGNIIMLECHHTHQVHKNCIIDSIYLGDKSCPKCPQCRVQINEKFIEENKLRSSTSSQETIQEAISFPVRVTVDHEAMSFPVGVVAQARIPYNSQGTIIHETRLFPLR